uniref:Uncharacterized protein n=1 Tax=Trichuris muris TaxID=70415 RepID=A0A5S6QML4_TRIMR
MFCCSKVSFAVFFATLITCHSISDIVDKSLNKEEQQHVKDALSQLRVIAEEKLLGIADKQKRENKKVLSAGSQESVMKRHESNLLFEGDIILSSEQAGMIMKSLKTKKQKR